MKLVLALRPAYDTLSNGTILQFIAETNDDEGLGASLPIVVDATSDGIDVVA